MLAIKTFEAVNGWVLWLWYYGKTSEQDKETYYIYETKHELEAHINRLKRGKNVFTV